MSDKLPGTHGELPPADDASEATILHQLMVVLSELREAGHRFRLRLCPQCKSPNLWFLRSYFDLGGAMGITPPKYLCPRCGYWSHVIIEVTSDEIDEALLDDLLAGDRHTAHHLLKQAYAQQQKGDTS